MRLSEIPSWQRSERVTIRPGDLVRLKGGGPEYVNPDGGKVRYRMPGRFKVKRIYQARNRTWLEVVGLDKISGCHVVYVQGKPFRRNCLRQRPYKVSKIQTVKQGRLALG